MKRLLTTLERYFEDWVGEEAIGQLNYVVLNASHLNKTHFVQIDFFGMKALRTRPKTNNSYSFGAVFQFVII